MVMVAYAILHCFHVIFRGVVQLFNAVRKHQTDVEEKLKEAKTEHKKEKLFKNIDKKGFLKMLNPEVNGPADEEVS